MNRFYSLIEYLKAEYLGQRNRNVGEEVPERYKSDIEPFFDIKVTNIAVHGFNHMKAYDVYSKNDSIMWKIIVGPASILYASNMEPTRARLLEERTVQGIFTLKNAFFRFSTIPTAVIVLDKKGEETWLTSALSTEDVVELMTDINLYKRKVYFTKELKPSNFMPEYYSDELNELNAHLDRYETKKLQDIAEIINGKNANQDHLSDTGIPYLRGRNLQNGKITNVDAFIRTDVAEDYAKQLLEEGDIILQKQFGYHKMVQVTADDLPAIASSGLFIIRTFGVPDSYLYRYVTSETGKMIFEKQIKRIEKGATIPSISLKDLKELRVPIFDEQTMLNFANVDNVSVNDLLPAIKEITAKVHENKGKSPSQVGSLLEEKVYNDFLATGWTNNSVIRDQKLYVINISKSERWTADITLIDDNKKLLAIVEVKTDFTHLDADWVKKMYSIVRGGEAPFLILTTGAYYEIHAMNASVVKKMAIPPTKELLLSLLKGKEGK